MSGTLTPCRLRSTRFQRPWPGALLLARLFPRMPPVIRHRRFFCALRVRCGCHGPGVRGLCPPPGPRSAFRFRFGSGARPRLAQGPAPILPALFSFGSGRAGSYLTGAIRRAPIGCYGGYYDTPHRVLCALCSPCRTLIFYRYTEKSCKKKGQKSIDRYG